MEKKPNHSTNPDGFSEREPGTGKEIREIELDCIIPNRFQPRQAIDQAGLQELMDSIKTAGVLEPIIVRQVPKQSDKYEIIMGERRFRACQALKKQTIPAVVKEADDRQMLEWALIENTHRKDLNPIERAQAYKRLADTFHLTHQQVAERVGVGRTTITHFIRLLDLPQEIQEDIRRQTRSVGHAIAILAVPDSKLRLKIWQRVKNEDLSVRHLRILVDAYLHPRGISTTPAARSPQLKQLHPGNDPQLRECAERLRRKLPDNINVNIHHAKFGDQFLFGSISLSYHKEDDLQRILKAIATTD
ncbi:MAG: ParB/RepB/Spo0J family partition protein [Planctomycetes bacterium]|nr:ParB/RepB/Spo0J family partition protein [Planctomycetota bacterium]